MHARVITLRAREGCFDQVMRVFRESIVPAAHRQPGFLGIVLLGDRKTGRVVSNSYWNTESDMLTSEKAEYLQEQISRLISVLSGPPLIEHYEVEVIS